MPKLAILTLAAVAVLMLKHAVADFYLQTPYQYLNKGTYGHRWTSQDRGFWHALGTDQLVHGLTYVAIVAALVAAS